MAALHEEAERLNEQWRKPKKKSAAVPAKKSTKQAGASTSTKASAKDEKGKKAKGDKKEKVRAAVSPSSITIAITDTLLSMSRITEEEASYVERWRESRLVHQVPLGQRIDCERFARAQQQFSRRPLAAAVRARRISRSGGVERFHRDERAEFGPVAAFQSPAKARRSRQPG